MVYLIFRCGLCLIEVCWNLKDVACLVLVELRQFTFVEARPQEIRQARRVCACVCVCVAVSESVCVRICACAVARTCM